MQDHGLDTPNGYNHLPVVSYLYAYTETSTLEEIPLNTADMNDRRRTQNTTKFRVAS